MLTITDRRFAQSPSVLGRRDFLRIGSLCGLSLPGLLAAKAQAATGKNVYKNKSVVFLYLNGGPPQIETFDPKLGVPENNRSCTGEIQTKLPGVWFGGTFPKLAQRADKEQGEFGEPGILSYYPGMMGYRRFFRNCGLKPKQPAWASAVYSETGVLLRNTVASDRETVLYMIAGRNHSHYFNDSGSITIWGKGRELCTEDDYQNRRNKDSRAAHSMPRQALHV